MDDPNETGYTLDESSTFILMPSTAGLSFFFLEKLVEFVCDLI
jgi:hypothetical protein